MERISTSGAYSAVLASLMANQAKQTQVIAQISSGETATDLKGYAGKAETLMAMQSVQSQVAGYVNSGQTLTAKLSSQNTALTQMSDASTSASKAITDALASGTGDVVMQSLQTAYGEIAQGLNTTFNGEYVFGGGQVNTPPVSATSLSALGAAPSVASVFHNDQMVQTAQVSQNTTLQTGFLASNLGTAVFTTLQAIQAYDQGPSGPLTGQLTSAQSTFLQGQLANLSTATAALNTAAGQNGTNQNQLASTQTSLTDQQTSLQGLVGNITNVNMGQAAANLQQAQLAVQASAQAFVTLNGTSLLNVLTGH
jgi:flagellar hook-associated protein 3 FlgL